METPRARHPRHAGTERRHVGINLSDEHWARLDRHAEEREEALSYVCTRIVRAWVVERLALDKSEKREVTADLITQGGDEVFLA